MRRLIVNADDCGCSASVNKAVEECYLAGRITGVSIMPAGEFFQEAVSMLKDLKKADVGVHLALTGGLHPSSSETGRLSALLGPTGVFVSGYPELAMRHLSGRIRLEHIYPELRAQIKKTVDSGLSVTHLDGHEHIHMFPGILKVLLRLACEFGIPYIRVPIENPVVITRSFSVGDLIRYTLLRTTACISRKHMKGTGIKYNDAFFGHFHSGRMTDDIFRFILDHIPPGITEIATHPDISPSKRPGEFDMLMNGVWKVRAEAMGIKLVSHREALVS
ncbi:MAG: ChbG/HpnK family deacetylase [Candidatus Omnitrophica bacterium]|nr:ChbG/HpnK family deacetylase [Candidatus Omnitrophota bacterium]